MVTHYVGRSLISLTIKPHLGIIRSLTHCPTQQQPGRRNTLMNRYLLKVHFCIDQYHNRQFSHKQPITLMLNTFQFPVLPGFKANSHPVTISNSSQCLKNIIFS